MILMIQLCFKIINYDKRLRDKYIYILILIVYLENKKFSSSFFFLSLSLLNFYNRQMKFETTIDDITVCYIECDVYFIHICMYVLLMFFFLTSSRHVNHKFTVLLNENNAYYIMMRIIFLTKCSTRIIIIFFLF